MRLLWLLLLLVASCRTPSPPAPEPAGRQPSSGGEKKSPRPPPVAAESEQERAERIARWETGARAFFSSQQSVLRACYETELQRVEEAALRGDYLDRPAPSLAGSLVLVVPVEKTGEVNEARLEENTLANENVDACLISEANRWNLPPPPIGETVEVELPLKFQLMGP